MAITRAFRSGNSQAVRIPADLAFEDMSVELEITRTGDMITIYPAPKKSLKDTVAELLALPPLSIEKREPIEVPERE